jgi:sulfur carrier protein ThiS adenylyltransferase
MSGIFDRNVPGSTTLLQRAVVGIAGCGGLGSNAALSLTRAGVGRLILVDPDVVEESNLNRQQFFREDLGRRKVEALAARLRSVNPAIGLEAHAVELTPADVPRIFADARVLIEAFDRGERKAWLIESWCRAFPDRLIVAASGLSGLGRTNALRVRRSGRIVVCGDETSEMTEGLCAPRVAIAANMLANVAVEWLVTGTVSC